MANHVVDGLADLPIALLAVVVGAAACTPASGAPNLKPSADPRGRLPWTGGLTGGRSARVVGPRIVDRARLLPLPTTSATQEQVDFLLARVAADPGDWRRPA